MGSRQQWVLSRLPTLSIFLYDLKTVAIILQVIALGSMFLLGSVSAEVVENRYANNFTIDHRDDYTLLTVERLWNGSGDLSYQYALVPKVAELPEELPEGVQVIRTPCERTALMATVFLGQLEALDEVDKVIGLAQAQFANNEYIREKLASKEIKQLSFGANLVLENILVIRPDLVLTSATGNAQYDDYPQLMRAGMPVVVTSAYMEQHPLGRAEWIKVISLFFDKETEAKLVFDRICDRYESLSKMASNASVRPKVLCNAPYSGAWYIPGGQSYTARAIADAGGDYLWADNSSRGGVPLDFESVLMKAAHADIWINPSFYESRKDMLQANERFAAFDALREGNVYNNNKRLNEAGGNDIWERGVQNPDEVLADLIKIFHPELLPDHVLVFHQRLP